jgi:L-threonylcarbamoyladenylate synthase
MSYVSTKQAIDLLNQGEIAAIPTETVYGLAARFDRENALRKIFATKQRPFFDPLIVHVADVEQARPLAADWPVIFDDLTSHFWPGPLTLVTKKTEQVSALITSGFDSVALRSPDHDLALEVLKSTGPLAAPSANRFGRTSPTCARDVEEEFGASVAVLDGGNCRVGVESTVLAVEALADKTWRIKILRPGGISRRQIQSALGAKLKIEFVRQSSTVSPGNLKEHYQPANPVVIVETSDDEAHLRATLEANFKRRFEKLFWLDLPSTPEQAARVLYSEFRRLSQLPGVIAVRRQAAHLGEDWEAIWDRLERASSLTLK